MFGEGGSRARLPAVAGVWMPWSSWSECSAPCDAGVQTRSRACTPPAFGGAECEGPLLQTRDCNPQPCGGACTAGCGALAPRGDRYQALLPAVPAAQCPGTMRYLTAEECRSRGGPCPRLCRDLEPGVVCAARCQPGCHCPAGLLLQDGSCVPPERCPCHHRGHLYQPGDTAGLDACNNWWGSHQGWGLGGVLGGPALLSAPPSLLTSPLVQHLRGRGDGVRHGALPRYQPSGGHRG